MAIGRVTQRIFLFGMNHIGPVYSRNMSLVRAAILEDTIVVIFLVETCLNYRNVFMMRIFGKKVQDFFIVSSFMSLNRPVQRHPREETTFPIVIILELLREISLRLFSSI